MYYLVNFVYMMNNAKQVNTDLQLIKVCPNLPRLPEHDKTTQACPSLPELARACPSLPELARACPSLPEPARACPRLLEPD